MKKVNFEKLQAGELVEVPRTQFAPQRYGWNGWLFSEAVVIRKARSKKNNKPMVVVEMRTPKSSNDYGTIEKAFYAEYVFQTNAVAIAKKFLAEDSVTTKEEFFKFIERDDVTGCDWIKFLVDKGFLFSEKEPGAVES